MSAGIVCVNPSVNIYRKFKFFHAFKPSSFLLLPSSLPLPYNTDATGHDINYHCTYIGDIEVFLEEKFEFRPHTKINFSDEGT